MTIIVFLFGLTTGYFLNIVINVVSRSICEEESRKRLSSYKDVKSSVKCIIILIRENLFLRLKIIDITVIIITGLLFSVVFHRYGSNFVFIKAAIMVSILVVASFIDLRHQIIPDTLVIITLILGLAVSFIGDISLRNTLLAMLLGGGILFILALIPGALGGGDIKLMFALGAFLGPGRTLWAILIAFIASACISILLLAFKVVGRKDHIPFGPFLALGSVLSFLLL